MLLIHPYAIHGDSTLVGDYLMAMTADHNLMASADTVFLNLYVPLNPQCNQKTCIFATKKT